jgi:hypothetical protein
LYPPARPQSIGEVLDSGFAIFRRSLWGCLPYGFLGAIAYQLPHLHDLLAGRPFRQFAWHDPIWWLDYALGLLISMLFYGAMLLKQRSLAGAQPIPASGELRIAVQRLPQLAILFVLIVIGLVIATLLLMIPGLYVGVAWLFAMPALVLDEMGPIEALAYSHSLVWGHWWRTVLIFNVVFAVLIALYASLGVAIGVVVAFTGVADLAVVTAVSAAASAVITTVALPFGSALLLAAYGELRVRREGLDLERRASAALAS